MRLIQPDLTAPLLYVKRAPAIASVERCISFPKGKSLCTARSKNPPLHAKPIFSGLSYARVCSDMHIVTRVISCQIKPLEPELIRVLNCDFEASYSTVFSWWNGVTRVMISILNGGHFSFDFWTFINPPHACEARWSNERFAVVYPSASGYVTIARRIFIVNDVFLNIAGCEGILRRLEVLTHHFILIKHSLDESGVIDTVMSSLWRQKK